jgi:hypothetical protein
MSATLQRLNQGTFSLSSQIPFLDTVNGGDRRGSVADLSQIVLGQLSNADGFVTQYDSPSASGFTVTASPFVAGGSVFLLLTPTGPFASGTVILPAQAIHGQKVTVHCTQAVTALAVSGNGAAVVSGAPTTLPDGGFFTLRYDGVTRGWYRVA